MDPNDKINVCLTRVQWTTIMQLLWKTSTCEVGVPLMEAIRPQIDGNMGTQVNAKAGNSKIVLPADD